MPPIGICWQRAQYHAAERRTAAGLGDEDMILITEQHFVGYLNGTPALRGLEVVKELSNGGFETRFDLHHSDWIRDRDWGRNPG